MRTIVFFESVDEDAHLEVPELDGARVERRGEERQAGVERDPLDPIRLGLELQRQFRQSSLLVALVRAVSSPW